MNRWTRGDADGRRKGRPPTFTGEAMRGDPRQAVSADVAEGGAGMGAGIPVVHP